MKRVKLLLLMVITFMSSCFRTQQDHTAQNEFIAAQSENNNTQMSLEYWDFEGSTDVLFPNRARAIVNSQALVIKDTFIYNNLTDFSVVDSTQKGSTIIVLTAEYHRLFIESSTNIMCYFYEVEFNNQTGWLRGDAIMFPFIQTNTEIVGVVEENVYSEEKERVLGMLRFVCWKNERYESLPLYDISDVVNSRIRFNDVNSIIYEDVNGDSNYDYLLNTTINEGLMNTDAVRRIENIAWINIRDGIPIIIFDNYVSGMASLLIQYRYFYDYSTTTDGVISTIRQTCQELRNNGFDEQDNPIYEPVNTTEHTYIWQDGRYIEYD